MSDRQQPAASGGGPAGADPAAAALARVRSGARDRPLGRGGRGPGTGSRGGGGSSADPQRIGASVSEWVRTSGHSTELAIAALGERWTAIVGDQVAAHATLGPYRDGRLTVIADSPEWAVQLRYLAGRIHQRVVEELGSDLVAGIDIRGPGPRRTPGGWRVRTGRRSPRQ